MLTGYLRGWGDAIDTWNFVRLARCYGFLELCVAGAMLTVTGTFCGWRDANWNFMSLARYIFTPPLPPKKFALRGGQSVRRKR